MFTPRQTRTGVSGDCLGEDIPEEREYTRSRREGVRLSPGPASRSASCLGLSVRASPFPSLLGPRRIRPTPLPPPSSPPFLVPCSHFSYPWRRRLGFPHSDDDVGLRLGGRKVPVGRFPPSSSAHPGSYCKDGRSMTAQGVRQDMVTGPWL